LSMFMAIQIEIKLVFHQHWQVVLNDMSKISIPFAPKWMMLDCGFPNNAFIFFPLKHNLINPLVLIVAPFSQLRVIADNVLQPNVIICGKVRILVGKV